MSGGGSDGRLRGRWLAYALVVWLGVSAFLFAIAGPQEIAWNVGPDAPVPMVHGALTTNAVHTRFVGIMTSDGKFMDFDCWPDGKNRNCEIPDFTGSAVAKQGATVWYVERHRGFMEGHSRRLLVRLLTDDGKIDFDRRAFLQRYRAAVTTEPDYDDFFRWFFVAGMMILISATKGFGGAPNNAQD